MRTLAIVNPAAAKGRAARAWPALRERLRTRLGEFEEAVTAGPLHASALARDAASRGVLRFVAVGGDGTVNETLNGLLGPVGTPCGPQVVLCPIPAGTGNELSRALGHFTRAADGAAAPDAAVEAAIAAAAGPNRVRVDAIRARCTGLDGTTALRFGYAACAYGAAATISRDTNRSRLLKRLGGRFSYYAATLLTTLTYRHRAIDLAIDGGAPERRTAYTGLVCNTENAGGGMRLAPGARFDDGMLDLVEFGRIGRLDILTQRPDWLYAGRHVEHRHVHRFAGRRFSVDCAEETLVDLDGETIGRLPLEVEIVPGAFACAAI